MHGTRLAALTAVMSALVIPLAITGSQAPTRQETETKISGYLDQRKPQMALSTYDVYVDAVKKPDTDLLRPIAWNELSAMAQSQTSGGERIVALYLLASVNDEAALSSLRKLAGDSPTTSQSGLEPTISLARLGDKKAAGRLGELLSSAPGDAQLVIIRALQEADARSEARRLVPLLHASDLSIRTAAAIAIGALQHHEAAPVLREMLAREAPVEKMVAALALKRLGDKSVDAHVAPLLEAILPEFRLMAAEAYGPSASAAWVPRIKELTTDRNELVRVRAAEALACCDAVTARATLIEALGSKLPSVQIEAARVLSEKGLLDARLARRLLGHDLDEVRVYGAGSVIRPASKKPAKGH